MLMATAADTAPAIPYFPELIFGSGSLLVLAALIYLVVMLVRRNRARREDGLSELMRQSESSSDVKPAP